MQRLIIIGISVVFLASCKIIQPNRMFEVPDNYQYSEFKPSKKEYILQAFDKLNIQVYTNDGIRLVNIESSTSLNQSGSGLIYLIEYNGMIKVPVLGFVKIEGLTVKEAEKFLEDKYSEYYQKPFILINVVNRRVIVFAGGSENGTVIPLTEENFTLIEALAQAGGISDFSRAYRIKLIRGNLNNPDVYLFNLSKISDLENVNLLLEANDIIYVEKRAKYASRILTEIAPYMSLLTTILLVIQLVR